MYDTFRICNFPLLYRSHLSYIYGGNGVRSLSSASVLLVASDGDQKVS